MTKEQFIAQLDKKLQVIKEDERKDIIDEYINHIDMKVQEGKTEEEAIEDFGDIDELVNDILDAYKINTNATNDRHMEDKFNDYLDTAFEKFKQFVSSFTMLDMDDVVKLLFEIFVVLIALIILRIPFYMVSSFGSSLLNSLGFGIGSILGAIWSFTITVIYIIVLIVVLVNVCSKRLQRYRNHESDKRSVVDDIKDSLRFESRKKTQSSGPYETQDEEPASHKEASNEDRNPYHKEFGEEVSRGVSSMAYFIAKIFCVLIMIPFFGIAIALCVASGFMISLSLQGITFIGAYLVLAGLMIGVFSFISLMFRTVFKGGSTR